MIKGAYITILFIAILTSCGEKSAFYSPRMQTALSRLKSDYPYHGYDYNAAIKSEERALADKMKTWSTSSQIISWEELAASIYRGDRPDRNYGCVYHDRRTCPGCHEKRVKVYYVSHSGSNQQEGWVILCLNCRKQVKFDLIKE